MDRQTDRQTDRITITKTVQCIACTVKKRNVRTESSDSYFNVYTKRFHMQIHTFSCRLSIVSSYTNTTHLIAKNSVSCLTSCNNKTQCTLLWLWKN